MKAASWIVLFLTLSLPASAIVPDLGNYNGVGTWKSLGKRSGTWAETMTFRREGNVHIRESDTKIYQNGKLIKDTKSVLKFFNQTPPDFFDVVADDKVVGSGFCFGINRCQMEYTIGTETTHETFIQGQVGEAKFLTKIGQVRGDANGVKTFTAWTGRLNKF